MDDLLLFGGFAAAGYVLAIYTWPAVRAFLAGAEQELAWLKSRVADIEDKLRNTLGRRG